MSKLTNIVVFFFIEHLPDNGRKMPKHVGRVLYDYIYFFHCSIVQFSQQKKNTVKLGVSQTGTIVGSCTVKLLIQEPLVQR